LPEHQHRQHQQQRCAETAHQAATLRSLPFFYLHVKLLNDTQAAAAPDSRVRIRTASPTGARKILPSPVFPVRQTLVMASTTGSAEASSSTISTRSCGTNSTWYSEPR